MEAGAPVLALRSKPPASDSPIATCLGQDEHHSDVTQNGVVAAATFPSGYFEEDILAPLENLLPNPEHPRYDWQNRDGNLKQLAAGMAEHHQLMPIICTPVDVPDAAMKSSWRLRIIDGHRRLTAASAAGISKVWARVIWKVQGQPLSEFEQLALWTALTLSNKTIARQQVIVAIVRLRIAWERQPKSDDERSHFFKIRELATQLSVSIGTISNGMKIAAEPPSIVEAVLSRSVQSGAVLALIDLIPEANRRADLVADMLRRNVERHVAGQPPLTIEQIKRYAVTGHTASDAAAGQLRVEEQPERAYRRAPRWASPLPKNLAIVRLYQKHPDPRPIDIVSAYADDLTGIVRQLTPSDWVELSVPVQRAIMLLASASQEVSAS